MPGMHTVLLQRYDDTPGLRDPGALEAALMESLAINHPFVDGNKPGIFDIAHLDP